MASEPRDPQSPGAGGRNTTGSRDEGTPVVQLQPSDLRDYGSSPSVERVWQRLERSLGTHPSAPERGASANIENGRSRGLVWSLAIAAVTFGAGIWVGRHSLAENTGSALLSREPVTASGNEAPTARHNLGNRDDSRPARTKSESEIESIRPQASSTDGPSLPSHRTRRGTARNNHVASELGPTLLLDPELQAAPPALVEGPPSDGPNAAPLLDDQNGAPPSWQRFANAGEYETALFVLGQSGGYEKALAEASAEQLMLLSDVAWATGQRQRSISALKRVVSEFPNDPVASVAAWSLGMRLEKAGDKQGALQAFADYRSLSPEGDFAEDALVRQIKAAAGLGNRERVKALAAQYEHDFPEGRRRQDVARWLAQQTPDTDDDAGAEVSETPAEASQAEPGASPPASGH